VVNPLGRPRGVDPAVGAASNGCTMNPELVRSYLVGLQDRLCGIIEGVDGKAKYLTDEWTRAEGGGGRTRVIPGGAVMEKGGVAFSDVRGSKLPPSATHNRPEPAGRGSPPMGASAVHSPPHPPPPVAPSGGGGRPARGGGGRGRRVGGGGAGGGWCGLGGGW